MRISDCISDVCSTDLNSERESGDGPQFNVELGTLHMRFRHAHQRGQADQHRNRYGPKQLLVRVIVIEQGTVHAKYSRHQLDFGAELVSQYDFLRNRIIMASKNGRDVGAGSSLIPAAHRTITKDIFERRS